MPETSFQAVPGGELFTSVWRPSDETPAKTPIMLLHDSLGSVALWRDFPAMLAEQSGRPVIAYDRLGYGRSTERHDMISTDFMVIEAKVQIPALLDQLGLSQVILGGHSVGGGMTITAAACLPDRIEAAFTIGAQSFVEPMTREGVVAGQKQFEDPKELARLQKYHGERAAWVVRSWGDAWLDPAFDDWSLDPWASQVKCPCLVIHGEFDDYATEAQPRRLAEKASGRCVIMEGVRHLPHRECPDRLAEVIDDFLSEAL